METPGTCKKVLMKGMLVMTFLLLFVPQLSYKFYLCVNNPSWTFKAQKSSRVSPVRTVSQTITYAHCLPLSIDKRYCLKHCIGLLRAEMRSVRISCPGPVYATTGAPGFANVFAITCSLRGPPPASAFF
jgi:hypothetical protein